MRGLRRRFCRIDLLWSPCRHLIGIRHIYGDRLFCNVKILGAGDHGAREIRDGLIRGLVPRGFLPPGPSVDRPIAGPQRLLGLASTGRQLVVKLTDRVAVNPSRAAYTQGVKRLAEGNWLRHSILSRITGDWPQGCWSFGHCGALAKTSAPRAEEFFAHGAAIWPVLSPRWDDGKRPGQGFRHSAVAFA